MTGFWPFSSFRIVKTTCADKTFYTAQKRTWFIWRNISCFYFSEFGDFPVIEAKHFVTLAEAENCITQFINFYCNSKTETVYQLEPYC